MIGNLSAWHLIILLVVALFFALVVGLWVWAIVSIARSTHLSGTARAVWSLAVVVAPVLGAVAWFVAGRRSRSGDRP